MPHENWSHMHTGTPGSVDAKILQDRSQPYKAWYILHLGTGSRSSLYYDPLKPESILRELGYCRIWPSEIGA